MNARDEYAVPRALRSARFVRWHPGVWRAPMRVTPKAFEAAGLPVPAERSQWNIYRLTECQGEPWSPQIDRHIARFGGELLGDGDLVQTDIDVPLAVDGTPLIDTVRWLADRAAEAGGILDLSASLAVRTPGHPESRHLPGWHAWDRMPSEPVRLGPLERCRYVELRARGTCPGSPGYEVIHDPGELAVLPGWLAALAGRPRPVAAIPAGACRSPGSAVRRLQFAIADLLEDGALRNNALYKAARRAGEAGLDEPKAVALLMPLAERVRLVAEDGEARCVATIRSGLLAAAQQPGGGAA